MKWKGCNIYNVTSVSYLQLCEILTNADLFSTLINLRLVQNTIQILPRES